MGFLFLITGRTPAVHMHVNFSPRPRWRPSVGNCMSHQVAGYRRCIAALTHGRPLPAWCPPHSSPDWTHTPHTLPQTQGGLWGIERERAIIIKLWHEIKPMCDGNTNVICLQSSSLGIFPRDSFLHQLLHFGFRLVKVINDGDSGENPPIHYVWPSARASNCCIADWMWAD